MFGEFITFVEGLTQSTNNTTTYVQKLRLTTPILSAGDYRIGWSYTWGNGSIANSTLVQIEQDDTTQLYEMVAEPKDNTINQEAPGSGFAKVTLTAGTHTFDMDFKSSATTDARIAQARLEFWKVD